MGLFKRKSKVDILQKKYEKLLKEAHTLSTVDRTASDKKVGEADLVLKEMEALQAKE